jgi:putative redox protein
MLHTLWRKNMKVMVKQVEGLTFVGKGETNHWVVVDGPIEFFGSAAGSRPMELVLMALGSCTGSDVVSILKKKKVPISALEIHLDGERREEIPKVFTKIHVEYVFYGSKLNTDDLKRAIDLSQNKYCPISAMLGKACEITHSYRVENP